MRAAPSTVLAGLGALLLVGAGLTVLGSADAATPTQGTVSAGGDHGVSWKGGPFVAPNATGTALDAPDCSAPDSCDDFTLHVDAPSTYGRQHQLKVTVKWSNAAADFDIYLLNGKGESVATAASSSDPELILAAPKAGDYTVRVVPFNPLGESYQATAKLVDKPDNPAPGTAKPPTFRNYKAPKSFTDANDAGEPSIGNSFKTGATMYQAYLSTFKVRWAHGDATWTDVSANAANGCPQGSTQSLDPILFTDRTTGRTFESQLTGVDSFTCYTDDDGKTWQPSTGGGIPSGVDHQTLGGGPITKGGLGSLPTTDYKHTVYYCSQDIATAFCAASPRRRHDLRRRRADVRPDPVRRPARPRQGRVRTARRTCRTRAAASNAAVVVSRDDGQSWTVRKVPVQHGRRLRPVGRDRRQRHRLLRVRRRRRPPRRRGQPRPRQDLEARPAGRPATSASRTPSSRPWSPAPTTARPSPTSAPPPAATTRTPTRSRASGTSTSAPPTTAAGTG